MKTVDEIYREFKIMPNLQTHQLRAGAVATLVCDNFDGEIHAKNIITAALFHDMGNIIKADLKTFPEFLASEGEEYWQSVKEEFLAAYGDKAHEANVAIARRIGLSERVIELIDGVSFSNMRKIAEGNDWDQKIVEYADSRVGPYGVLSVRDRLEEARRRYIDSGKTYYTSAGFDDLARFTFTIERQIFEKCRIKPEDITEETIAPLMNELRNYTVA